MPDFSDKYRDALDSKEISPDFKERTAKMMTKIRDSEPKKKRSKIIMSRAFSVVAAAAACFAVGFSLKNAGVFEIPTIKQTTAAAAANGENNEETSPESTQAQIIRAIPNETAVTSAAVPAEDYAPSAQNNAQINPTEQTEQTRAVTEITAPETQAEISAAAIAEAPSESILSDVSINSDTIAEIEIDDGKLQLGSAEYIAPNASTDVNFGSNPDIEYDQGLSGGDTESIVEDDSFDENTNVTSAQTDVISQYESAEHFSAQQAVSKFRTSDAFVAVIPNFDGYSEDAGGIISYDKKTVTDTEKITAIEDAICDITLDDTSAYLTEIPNDSRYIIDFADTKGNALRIYIGKTYICFSVNTDIYSYELTQSEFELIDSELFELIK